MRSCGASDLFLNKFKVIGTLMVKCHLRNCVRLACTYENNFTPEPIYPNIKNTSPESKYLEHRHDYAESIKAVNTVEEKLLKINMPRYYGYKCVSLSDKLFSYNCLPYFQHSTRTLFEEVNHFPNSTTQSDKIQAVKQDIKNFIQEAISFEYAGKRNTGAQKLEAAATSRQIVAEMVKQLNRIIINALAAEVPHLSETEVDFEPRHEAFWFVGGIIPPRRIANMRKRKPFLRYFADSPVDRGFQYTGNPVLTLRHKYPLAAVSSDPHVPTDSLNELPQVRYDPKCFGYTHEYRHGTTIPGFWPGALNEFGLISYFSRDFLVSRITTYSKDENQSALHAQGIVTGYSWLFGQACYQGFSTYNDLNYPLVTQTIITDGQYYSFYIYQLNTTLIHSTAIDSNPKVNKCWGTKEMKLFDTISDDGKIIGFNDDVLNLLIQFYINQPQPRSIELKPFLSEDEQTIADIEHLDKRVFLEDRFKNLFANTKRHRLVPEIYHWEKIYKIDNKTIPLAPRLRFFEVGTNPYARRLDEHTPKYVPKALRPDGKKKAGKWMKTYYP